MALGRAPWGNFKTLALYAVLPDFDRWGDNYVLIDFEGDPTSDHPRLQKLPAHKRLQLAGAESKGNNLLQTRCNSHNLQQRSKATACEQCTWTGICKLPVAT
jgi:hypothetical protein